MKYLRLTSRPDPDAAPEAFRLLAASDHATEARLVGWNLAESRGVTGLFAVDGDREALVAGLSAAPAVVAVDAAPGSDGWFYLLVTLSAEGAPLVGDVFETLTRDGTVVVTPVVYRDGAVHARLVGDAATVGATVEAMPSVVDVEIEEVGQRGFAHEAAATLSDRQREAVLAALDLGYYDQPRGATHEAVAERLGCAPSTASEHLQKAEAKLVRAAMGGGG